MLQRVFIWDRIKAMKTSKRIFVLLTSSAVVLTSFYLFWLSPRYTVPILFYHSFGYSGDLLTVTPENFEKQMRYIKEKGYHVISLDELAEGIRTGRKFAHTTVVITSDDGYKNNYTYAYPVLKKYGYPATIFLIANLIGNNDNFLNWDEVREMAKNKISFGGHTKNHVYLPSIGNDDILRDEIAGCKEVIEKHMGAPIDYFCYPTGGFTEKIKAMVKRAGYKGACTTNRGFDFLNKKDLYELDRIAVRNLDPYASLRFRIKLSGYYNLFRVRKGGA